MRRDHAETSCLGVVFLITYGLVGITLRIRQDQSALATGDECSACGKRPLSPFRELFSAIIEITRTRWTIHR